MRTAILLSGILISFRLGQIANGPETPDAVVLFVSVVLSAIIVMDVVDFFTRGSRGP